MYYGFIKTACASPELKVADCTFNAKQIIEEAQNAAKKGTSLIVFPELSITGYTCGDLFFQQTLQKAAENQLKEICSKTSKLNSLIFVGLPVPQARKCVIGLSLKSRKTSLTPSHYRRLIEC